MGQHKDYSWKRFKLLQSGGRRDEAWAFWGRVVRQRAAVRRLEMRRCWLVRKIVPYRRRGGREML